MLNALDINTKEIIASGVNREELKNIASEIVGNEGYCIRSAEQEEIILPKNWCETEGQWWI